MDPRDAGRNCFQNQSSSHFSYALRYYIDSLVWVRVTSGTSQAASHNAELRRVVDLRADVGATHQIVHGYGDCYSPLDVQGGTLAIQTAKQFGWRQQSHIDRDREHFAW
jgi:hypothetical protein